MAAGVRDRRIWVVVAVVVAALLGMAWLRAISGSDGDLGAASSTSPSASASGTPSPTSTVGPSPSPGATTSPSVTATGSPAPPAPSSATPKPRPRNPIADDGLPTVTIDRPEPGSTVGIPVLLSGTVVAFEAVLRYEVLDRHGDVIANGPAYADAGAPERGRWQVEVELPIGSYTAVAFVKSPQDGSRIAQTKVRFRTG